MDSLIAGVRCGANAVYLGADNFNARRNAANFSEDELKNAVSYAHARGVKVHVTLNTLVSDEEIDTAIHTIKHICNSGADVLILQDLGIAALAKKCAPEIERHASTQMSVQTARGIRLLEKMGFSRAVLPRETSLEEIKRIKSETHIELEYFVHGALCMCVSGQCYLSAMLGSRSGNRGLCAQPCRLPFSAEGGTGFDLSLKDLSLIDEIGKISEAGVCSLKIEGRMKRPEYVAAAVTACKNACNNVKDSSITNALKAVFSRSGFTKGYFENKIGRSMFGTRMKEDVTAAKDVLPMLQRLYDRETALIPVDFYMTVLKGEKISLSVRASGQSVYAESDCIPEKALNKPMTEEILRARIAKCGGTQFYPNEIEIDLDDGLIAPSSVINGLRRQVLDELNNKLSRVKSKQFRLPRISLKRHRASERKIYIRLRSLEQLPERTDGISMVYVPLDTDIGEAVRLSKKIKVCVETPRGIFAKENQVFERLRQFKENGINSVYCTTLDGLAMARELEMEIHAGFTMNIFNSLSLEEIRALGASEATVSAELTLSAIKRLGGEIKRGIIAYGNIPLMLTKNCPIRNGKGCKTCQSGSYLTDRMGVRFPVVCSYGCSEILNSRPIYLADRLNEIENVDFITLYFTVESRAETEKIISGYLNGEKPSGEFTRGLYYRGVE